MKSTMQRMESELHELRLKYRVAAIIYWTAFVAIVVAGTLKLEGRL